MSNNLTAFAQEVKSTEKKAFKFISVDDVSDIRYTYEENGSKYMVKEHANKELTEVTTDIYELNGKKILLKDHYVTNIYVKKGLIEISTSYRNNKKVFDKISVNNIVEVPKDINVRAKAKARKGWVHVYDYKGSVKFAKYTLAVVISVLGGSIAAMSGITYVTGGAIAGITEIAKIIVNERLPFAYMKQRGYYYYPKNNNGIPTKMKQVTKCYRKSNGTGYLGKTTSKGKIVLGGN